MIRGLQRTAPLALASLLAVISVFAFSFGHPDFLSLLTALVVCALFALLAFLLQSARATKSFPKAVEQLLNLSQDSAVAEIHSSLAASLRSVSEIKDSIFRRYALKRLHQIADQTEALANAKLEFTSTEGWRVVYDELLRSPGLHLYRSVAHIQSAAYWQEGPGQQSTRLNLELQDARTVRIERTAIIADHLWPEDSLFPVEPVHGWLKEQHRHGIWVRLARESELQNERDLLADWGIYGSRAVGTCQADIDGRTSRFTFTFDFDEVKKAEERWERLSVYCVSYRHLLDQQH